ncbi:MAG: ShlB/FhaC/HecB family hemolysin secretion/activation protein [Pseudomonadota bacterium]
MKKLTAGILIILELLFICSLSASAADLPGTVQPGQIEQQFKRKPEILPKRPDRVIIPEADQTVPSNAQDIVFNLKRLVIEGSTVYSEKNLIPDYKNYLNREVSLADIYQIASTLTARYRNDGYILSKIVVPAQSIEDGQVRLKVIEGYIADIIVEGADKDQRKLVQDYEEKIRKCRPVKIKVIERYLLLMNDLPGAIARAVIKPSQKEQGASEMIVQFDQSKVQTGLSLDNRGGESLGHMRISADIGLNSMLGLQEKTMLRFVSSGNKKLNFGSISHEENIGTEGGKFNLSLSAVKSKPKDMEFIPLDLETSSQSGALTYIHPLIRNRTENLYLRGSFTLHNGKTKIFGVTDTRDRIRAVRLGATFDLADAWGVNLLDIEVSQGIDGLGSSNNNDMMLSRPEGRVDFTKMTAYAARVQSLVPRWSFLVAANAQYACTDLLSSELYSFGGEQIGRGYDPSELVGDNGFGVKLELRYTGIIPRLRSFSYTGYAFYDAGRVYQRSPNGLSHSESAASAGLGLRMKLWRNISCYAELAKPLTHEVSAKENREARGYAGIYMNF